jgi:hypothetical protein
MHLCIPIFSYLGIRNYQILDKSDRGEDTNLVEIGPRMVRTEKYRCIYVSIYSYIDSVFYPHLLN